MVLHRFGVAMALVMTFGCAAGSASSSTGTTPATARKTDLITQEELTADPVVASGDAYTAVRRLRPAFLSTRGGASSTDRSAGTAQISVDGGPLQSLDNLSRYPVTQVQEIRYLSPNDAAQRYGANARGGAVILVKSK